MRQQHPELYGIHQYHRMPEFQITQQRPLLTCQARFTASESLGRNPLLTPRISSQMGSLSSEKPGSLVIRVTCTFSLFQRTRSWQVRLNHREHRGIRRVVIFIFRPLCALCGFPKTPFRKYQKVSVVLVIATRDTKDPFDRLLTIAAT